MKSFGEYLRRVREERDLPLRKVAAALDIDTSILSKIERNERRATIDMIEVLAKTLDVPEEEVEFQFLQSSILSDFGELKSLKDSLMKIIKTL